MGSMNEPSEDLPLLCTCHTTLAGECGLVSLGLAAIISGQEPLYMQHAIQDLAAEVHANSRRWLLAYRDLDDASASERNYLFLFGESMAGQLASEV